MQSSKLALPLLIWFGQCQGFGRSLRALFFLIGLLRLGRLSQVFLILPEGRHFSRNGGAHSGDFLSSGDSNRLRHNDDAVDSQPPTAQTPASKQNGEPQQFQLCKLQGAILSCTSTLPASGGHITLKRKPQRTKSPVAVMFQVGFPTRQGCKPCILKTFVPFCSAKHSSDDDMSFGQCFWQGPAWYLRAESWVTTHSEELDYNVGRTLTIQQLHIKHTTAIRNITIITTLQESVRDSGLATRDDRV